MSEVIFNFSGKNFVVVGASSGMGRQIALELAEAGAHVLAVARNQERLQAVKDQYPDLVDYAMLDVTTATDKDWEQTIGNFVKMHGKINGEVYTAGVSVATPLRFFDDSAAREIMESSFWGAIKSLKAAAKKKFAMKGSSYVFFSSIAAYSAEPSLAVYSATKAAVQSAMGSFCHDLSRDGHRINTISPGWVRTNMTETGIAEMGERDEVMKRHLLGIGEPSDVSGMVLFLLSDRAKWITGEDFVVDGGLLRGAFS